MAPNSTSRAPSTTATRSIPQEVIEKWGRKEIVGDYVRLIRTLRPDVIVTMNIQGRGGDRAHEATTILVREGYRAAGDPSMYPEQIREGLRPWQPKKLYFSAGFGGPGGPGGRGGRGGPGAPAAEAPQTPPPAAQPAGPPVKLTPVNTAAYDPLLGRTYAEIGSDARSNHKCQGMGGLPPLPGIGGGRGGARRRRRLSAHGEQSPRAGGEGRSVAFRWHRHQPERAGAVRRHRIRRKALISGLAAILAEGKRAQAAFAAGNDAGTAAPVEAGLAAVRALRAQLPSLGLSDSARYEIDFRLKLKERDYQDAVLAAHGVTFDAAGRRRTGGRRAADQALSAGRESRRVRCRRDRRRPSRASTGPAPASRKR